MKKCSKARRACAIVPVTIMLGCGTHAAQAQGNAIAVLPIIMALPGGSMLAHDLTVTQSASLPALRLPAGPLPDGTPVARVMQDQMPQVFRAAAPAPAAAPVEIAQATPPQITAAGPASSLSPASTPTPPIPAHPLPPLPERPMSIDTDTGSDAPLPPPPPADATDAPLTDSSAVADNVAEPPPGAIESLRDAIVEALKSNPDIQISLAQQDDSRFAVGQATAGYLPHVDMNLAYGREVAQTGHTTINNRGTDRNRVEGTVTVTQNVWDFGTTLYDIQRARASYRSAQWATREKIESIAFDITNAYLAVLQTQKLIGLTNDEIAANKKILRMVTVQKDLGLTTQADVDRSKARLENVQSTLLDRKSALQQARDSYRRLTNHLPGLAVDLAPSEAALPTTAGAAVDMIDTNSPRMAQAVEDRRSLAKQYASQTGTFFPRVGILLQGNHKYDVQGKTGLADDARAMVTLSYSFFNGGADIALRNRIGARIRQADYELDRRRREVEADIRADFQALSAAREKIATIDAEITSAQRVAELYRQQFREGKRSVFDLLDSEQVLYAARGNEVVNGTAMHLAEYRVLQKLGGLFDLVSSGEKLPPLVVPAPIAPKKKK